MGFSLERCHTGAMVGPGDVLMQVTECCDDVAIAVAVPGIPGPPGDGTGVTSYLHTEAAPSAVWHVIHNLGQMIVECATVYDLTLADQYYNVIVEPLTPNDCNLYFADPVSGYALIQR